MKKSFWLPIALGLCAYLVLPLPGLSAPLSDRIEQKREQIDQAKQKEGVLTTTIQGFSTRIDALQGEIQATQSRLDRAQDEPRSPEGRAARGARPARGRARPARAPAQRARHRAAGAGGPARGDLQVGHARRPHRRARGRRLRATCWSAPSSSSASPTRTARSPTGCAACATRRRTRPSSWPSSRSASSSPPSGSCASATRSPLPRTSSSSSRDQLASARADRQRGARPGARRAAQSLEGDLRALEAEQARVAARAPGPGAARDRGPIKQGSGQLVWPVNGPGGVALRHALGAPARRRRHRGAGPARRSARPTRARSC